MEEYDIDIAVAKWTDRVLSAAKKHIPKQNDSHTPKRQPMVLKPVASTAQKSLKSFLKS